MTHVRFPMQAPAATSAVSKPIPFFLFDDSVCAVLVLSSSQNVLYPTLAVFALCSAFRVSVRSSACNCVFRLIAVQLCRRSCCILTAILVHVLLLCLSNE